MEFKGLSNRLRAKPPMNAAPRKPLFLNGFISRRCQPNRFQRLASLSVVVWYMRFRPSAAPSASEGLWVIDRDAEGHQVRPILAHHFELPGFRIRCGDEEHTTSVEISRSGVKRLPWIRKVLNHVP